MSETKIETFTADADWTVPDRVGEIEVELEGERGESFDAEPPGDGGRVAGVLEVTPGETLFIRESSGGGEGLSFAAPGGSSVDIRRGGTSLSDRIAVAGGGGGEGRSDSAGDTSGGDGGPNTGEDGGESSFTTAATGGTQTDGGSGGTQSATNGADGEDGEFGAGGKPGSSDQRGGGGGAGWYGGGGGASTDNAGSGGAGGSNYTAGLDTVNANERGTSSRSHGDGGLVTIEYLQPPEEAANVSAERVTDDDIEVTWGGDVNDGEYRLYRDFEPPVDENSTLVATVESGTSHSVTDTPTFGGRYRYAALAWDEKNGISSSVESNEVTVPIIAPSDLAVDDVRDAEADLSWTDNADNEAGYRVDVREDDDGAWETAVDDLPADTTSATAAGLLNGQLYGARAVAVGLGLEIADIDPDVLPGETLTIASGETFEFQKPHVNQGTVENAGTMQPDDLQ